MKRFLVLLAALTAFASGISAAQMKPEDAIKNRKAAFTVLGYNFGSIGAMANDRKPYNKAEAEKNANLAAAVAHMPFELFPAGSDKGDTKAKANIWSDMNNFKLAGEKMNTELARLAVAAKGDLSSLKAAFGEAAKTCKGCHDEYKEK